MEKNDEINGSGNSYDFGARMYDPRVARWWGVDPMQKEYPSYSSYMISLNSPIRFIDPNGEFVIDPSFTKAYP